MLAVLLGDAIHNLRSALDHLLWQLVVLDSGKDGTTETQFPIESSGSRYWSIGKDGLDSLRDRRLRGLSKEHKAMIDTCQPYRIRGQAGVPTTAIDPLATLQDLSNHDKHRLLHILIFAVDVQQEHGFRLVANEDAGEQLEATLAPFSEDGPVQIMTVEFSCPGPNPNVFSEGDLMISPGVEVASLRLKDLPRLAEIVLELISRFAPDFP